MIRKYATSIGALALLFVVLTAGAGAPTAKAVTCSPTGYNGLTAALINPGNVSGEVDATGCNIGIYYDSGAAVVAAAEVHGANWFGIFVNGDVNNVEVDVLDSAVYDIGEDPFNGAQHGVGIYYRALAAGSATGIVRGNEVYEYQKGGIVVNGAGANVNVQSNVVTGLEDVPFIAQNGIQFGYGSTGNALNNVVDGNWYTGASWSSTGILVFQASSVQVTGNVLTGNQVGIGIETWCYLGGQSASNNHVNNNSIAGSKYGVTVAAYDFLSSCDPSANGNRVVNNNLVGTDGSLVGIWLGTGDQPGGFTPEAVGNKLIGNDIEGFDLEIERDGDAGTMAHANDPIH